MPYGQIQPKKAVDFWADDSIRWRQSQVTSINSFSQCHRHNRDRRRVAHQLLMPFQNINVKDNFFLNSASWKRHCANLVWLLGVFAENVCLSVAWCIILKPLINSSMEKVTGSLGWKVLGRNQAWGLQVQPLWQSPLEYFFAGHGPFNLMQNNC